MAHRCAPRPERRLRAYRRVRAARLKPHVIGSVRLQSPHAVAVRRCRAAQRRPAACALRLHLQVPLRLAPSRCPFYRCRVVANLVHHQHGLRALRRAQAVGCREAHVRAVRACASRRGRQAPQCRGRQCRAAAVAPRGARHRAVVPHIRRAVVAPAVVHYSHHHVARPVVVKNPAVKRKMHPSLCLAVHRPLVHHSQRVERHKARRVRRHRRVAHVYRAVRRVRHRLCVGVFKIYAVNHRRTRKAHARRRNPVHHIRVVIPLVYWVVSRCRGAVAPHQVGTCYTRCRVRLAAGQCRRPERGACRPSRVAAALCLHPYSVLRVAVKPAHQRVLCIHRGGLHVGAVHAVHIHLVVARCASRLGAPCRINRRRARPQAQVANRCTTLGFHPHTHHSQQANDNRKKTQLSHMYIFRYITRYLYILQIYKKKVICRLVD